MAKKPNKHNKHKAKPQKPMTSAQLKRMQRQQAQAQARKAQNLAKTEAKHTDIGRKAAMQAGASADVAGQLAKGLKGSKAQIREQAAKKLAERKAEAVSRAENRNTMRSKSYAEKAQKIRDLLQGDYWDLAEAGAAGRYEEALRHNKEYLERKLNAVDTLRTKYENELQHVDNAQDKAAIEQILDDLDDKEEEIREVLYTLEHPISAKYHGDPLAKYFM